MKSVRGACHCGGLRVDFHTAQYLATLHPRACDCSFCLKHGAAWVSDPEGKLSLLESSDGALGEYRQGSNTARFIFCRRCGVLVAVVFEQMSRVFGAVNQKCLDSHVGFGESVSASPQKLGADEKASRWSQLWIPDVEVLRFSDKTNR